VVRIPENRDSTSVDKNQVESFSNIFRILNFNNFYQKVELSSNLKFTSGLEKPGSA